MRQPRHESLLGGVAQRFEGVHRRPDPWMPLQLIDYPGKYRKHRYAVIKAIGAEITG
jgi:hypothetical protein